MTDTVAFGHIEVIVCLYTTVVGVGRHGVPDRTCLKLCQTHLKLTRTFLKNVINNQLIDYAVVAFGKRAGFDLVRLDCALPAVDRDQLCLVMFVGACGIDVEFGGISGILASEGNFFVSLTDIQRILEMQFVILAVHIHYAVATGIDHTKLAAFQKILRLEGIYCLKLDSLRYRHDTSENETVIHSVCEVNLIRLHHFFHQKTGTELLVVVMFHICGMTRVKNLIVGLCLHRATRRKHK